MTLETLGRSHGTDKAAHGYLPIYERHLKDLPVRSLLEIGVLRGNSVRMWADYFPEAQIYGLDISPTATKHASDRIDITIGSQDDPRVIEDLIARSGGFDVVIDDGSHVNELTLKSFELLWPATRHLYVIEDLANSYMDLTPHVAGWPGMDRNRAGLSYRNRRIDMDAFFVGCIRAADRSEMKVHFYKWMAVFER